MTKYKIRKDTLLSEDSVRYVAYGINAYTNGTLVRCIPDISLDKPRLAALISLCNKLHLDIIHLDDVIEDFLIG